MALATGDLSLVWESWRYKPEQPQPPAVLSTFFPTPPLIEGRPSKRTHSDTSVKELHSETTWYPVAYDGTESMKKFKMKDDAARTVWETFYGVSGYALCIVCQVMPLDLSRAETQLAHVVSRSCGGRNDKTYNYIYCCGSCNNSANKAKNLYDQLALSGKLSRALVVTDALLALYCKSEPAVTFQFRGRVDFVQRVYGEVGRVRGGVNESRVFEYLATLDDRFPLSDAMLHPFHRSLL